MDKQTTPAPWIVVESPNGDLGIRNEGGYLFFSSKPTHYEGQDERYLCEMDERSANAKLAASAPILKELVEKQDQLIRIYSDVIIPDGKLYKEIETLKAKL